VESRRRFDSGTGPSRSRAEFSRRLLVLSVFALLAVWTRDASAYAWMIRHEYGGCNQCHADPSGGGLLTAYGRVQGETLLRTQYSHRSESEDPGKTGDFLLGAFPLPESVLLGGDVRALEMYIKPQNGPSLTRTIFMQADLEGQVAIGRFRANASIGYAHEGALGASLTRGTGDRLISRVYWVGVDLGADREWTLRAGRMNVPFGIRSIEHTLFVRQATRVDINDTQQHGVSLAYNGDSFRGELMAMLGNYQIHPDAVRERGYAGYLEYVAIPRLAIGVSSLVAHSAVDRYLFTPLWRQAHGVTVRYSPFEQLVLSTETDLLVRSQPSTSLEAGVASMLQADVEPVQGLHFIGTAELLDERPAITPPSYALWGSVAWFFLPHLDVRGDAIWQSNASAFARSNADVFLLQLHAYL